MRKLTQQEFDAIERDEFGYKNIPANTDCREIVSFGKYCSFGDGCSFGECCSFGDGCSFGERCSFGECCSFGGDCSYKDQVFTKYYQFGGFGSVERTTRVYLLETGNVLIECGRQVGLTLDQFEQRVINEYDDDTEHGILYRAIIEVIKKIEGLK